MRFIPLSQGLFALVSTEDFEYLSRFKWSVSFGSGSGKKPYAIRRCPKTKKRIAMHREILGVLNTPCTVDHKNNFSLDNRRINLEIVSSKENTRRAKRAFNRL